MMDTNPETLSHGEKEVLRLFGQGFDAKSAATELGISVHTVNERLRSARRKLHVTSSREAARMLVSSERGARKTAANKKFGIALDAATEDKARSRRVPLIGGLCVMLLIVFAASAGLLAPSSHQGQSSDRAHPTSSPTSFEARNEVRLEDNRLLWNGQPVSEAQMGEYLKVVRQMNPQPPTVLSYGAAIPQERVQRARIVIDGVLHCTASTCVEVRPQPR